MPTYSAPAEASDEKYSSDEKKKEILEFVTQRYSKMRQARSNFDSEWEDSEAAYIAPFKSNDQYQADVNLPVEFSHIQHMMAEIMDSPPKMVFEPKNSRGVEKLDVAQSVWDFAWEKADTNLQMFWLYLSMFVIGNGVWFEGYQITKRKSFKKIGLNKDDLERLELPEEFLDSKEYEETEVTEYDDVYGEWVPSKEFYMDENARVFWEPTHTKDARDCIRRRFYSSSSFHIAFAKYPSHSKVKDTFVDSEGYKNSEEARKQPSNADTVEVLEYWNRELQLYVIVVNRECVLTCEAMPYDHGRLPFAVATCFPIFNSPWGLGLVALLRGIRAQEDLIVNIGIDQGKNTIQPPLLKASTMEVLDEEWYAGMGYILNVNGSITDIKELPVGELSNSFFSLLDKLELYEVLSTGSDVRALVSSEPTAFQQANKKEISLKRLKVILQFVNWDGLAQMADLRYANMRSLYREGDMDKVLSDQEKAKNPMEGFRSIRVKNKEIVQEVDPETGALGPMKFMKADGHVSFFDLDPQELEDYDITVTFQLNTSKELRKLRFQEAFNVLPQILQVIQIDLFNGMEVLEHWADTYDMPQTLLNKTSANINQMPLGQGGMQLGPDGKPVPNPINPPTQMPMAQSPQTMDGSNALQDKLQNGFNVAQTSNPQ